jgi:hypothetical protein
MDTRTLGLHDSMRRIANVVNAHPALGARAAESKAFEQFLAVIARLDALQVEQSSAPIELGELAARTKTLMGDLSLVLESIDATADIIPNQRCYWPDRSLPSVRLEPCRFCIRAAALIHRAAEHAPTFIEYGLHLRTFDDAQALLAELIEVDRRRCYLEATSASFGERLKHAVVAARKRRRQLSLDLRRTMTAEMRADWERAHSLGRAHRRKALTSGTQQKLLPAPKDTVAPNDVDAAEQGIKRFARRVALRIAGTGDP